MEKSVESLKIRPLVPEDRERVYTFFRQLGDEGSAFFNYENNNEKGVYEYLNGLQPDRIYWGAIADTPDGEEIAGLVFLWKKNTKVPWLGIAVTEKWKGRHLGRRLMATAVEWAKAANAGGILLTTATTNVRGQTLYERCGFERIGIYHDGEIIYLLTFPNDNVN